MKSINRIFIINDEYIMIKVSIIEDDAKLAGSLEQLINQSKGFSCVSAYNNCEDAINKIVYDNPDVILMDIKLSGEIDGIKGTGIIKEKMPSVDIIMLTNYVDNEYVFQSIRNGAVGYIVKSISLDRILDGITEVYNGGAPMSMTIARKVVESFNMERNCSLTIRESEVLELLCQGKSYQAIANKLYIEKTTVKYHCRNIYHKLHVHNKGEAISKANRSKLI